MASYRPALDQKPGGNATIDEFAAVRWSTFEQAQAGCREITAILRQRYPNARAYVYVHPIVPSATDGKE